MFTFAALWYMVTHPVDFLTIVLLLLVGIVADIMAGIVILMVNND